jgi:hypothetical protein
MEKLVRIAHLGAKTEGETKNNEKAKKKSVRMADLGAKTEGETDKHNHGKYLI